MDIVNKLADQAIFDTLSIGEKIQGALVVTLLGISITFIVLMILLVLIKSMAVIFKTNPEVKPVAAPVAAKQPVVDEFITEEEIAAVTAAIIAHTNKKNIVISSIREVKASWKSAAKLEQIK